MKRYIALLITLLLCICCLSCAKPEKHAEIIATTLPVYDITSHLCERTDLSVSRLITEDVSCLHDYTLTPRQMMLVESAEVLVISGAGFESFMEDVIATAKEVIDTSENIPLQCSDHEHGGDHAHEYDPHFWLSPENGRIMSMNIHAALCNKHPEYKQQFDNNLLELQGKFDDLEGYAKSELSSLSCREIITFHDGFSYMSKTFDLTILHSMEEESGSEASAADLISICDHIITHKIPAIFTEKNGSDRAATIVARETGVKVYELDTGLSGNSYFNAIYHNINTLKEALG